MIWATLPVHRADAVDVDFIKRVFVGSACNGLLSGMDQIKEHRERVIAGCEKYNEIGPLEDGFQYFWIKDRGAMSAADLRVIADELDRRNKDWQEQIERDLSR